MFSGVQEEGKRKQLGLSGSSRTWLKGPMEASWISEVSLEVKALDWGLMTGCECNISAQRRFLSPSITTFSRALPDSFLSLNDISRGSFRFLVNSMIHNQ